MSAQNLSKEFLGEHVMDRVAPQPYTGCWLWMNATSWGGYGKAKISGTFYDMHRIAYIAFNGPIEGGLVVRHACDEPLCCNPDHLLLGTHKDNSADMVKRRRHSIQKLSDADVMAILDDDRGAQELATLYGVTVSNIYYVRAGKTYKHLYAQHLAAKGCE